MSGKIVELDVITRLDLDPQRVLSAATNAELQRVVIIGADENNELYFAASEANVGGVLWDIEQAKRTLLQVED